MKYFLCAISFVLAGFFSPVQAGPVIKRPLEAGISFDEVVQSMKLRANTLNS